MLLWLKIYLCWRATRICSRASFILVYINDIAKKSLSLTRLFALYSSIFYAAANIADMAGIINHDLQMLPNWAKERLVTFYPLKTEAVLFTLKKLDFFSHLIF